MKITTQDLYHGAVLTQITEHDSFKALNKVDELYGHYLINHDTRLFVKYLTKNASPWNFRFHPSELQSIQNDLNSSARVFICLVCGDETVCCLSEEEFSPLIDLADINGQSIIVEVPRGGSMHVKGSQGKLPRTIRHRAFPDKIFVEVENAMTI
ncbi:hypothetical protein ACFOGI_11050 [Virgibacillus xinjiangensis]|uniref:Uncharacterized protein n=1 Tax=Virgibacillus xinjiangensis TaxID=393090 RepID=A0ABV7CX03_9BACI